MSTSWVVDDLVDDAAEFLDGGLDDLVAVLEELASLGDVEAPTPSDELALLLAGRPAGAHRPVRRTAAGRWAPARSHRRLAPALGGLAAAAVAGLTLTGTAAYAGELPAPMQRVVAHLSEDYLPFTFPRPVGDPPAPARTSPRGAGARSSGDAQPGTEPSAVARSGVEPSWSTGGPTDRVDERLVRQDLRPATRAPSPSPAPRPSPLRPGSGPYGVTVTGSTITPAVLMTPVAPTEQASESPSGPLDPVVVPPTGPSATDTSPGSVETTSSGPSPTPSSGPSPTPSSGPSSSQSPSGDPSSSQAPTAPSGAEPTAKPTPETPPPVDQTPGDGQGSAGGRTPSQTAGPDATPPTGATTAPPGSPSDLGGSQPVGPPSITDNSPASTRGSSPTADADVSPPADLGADPGTPAP